MTWGHGIKIFKYIYLNWLFFKIDYDFRITIILKEHNLKKELSYIGRIITQVHKPIKIIFELDVISCLDLCYNILSWLP